MRHVSEGSAVSLCSKHLTRENVMVIINAPRIDGYTVTPVCSCGQDLDCCEREHCPRCGCEIHRAA